MSNRPFPGHAFGAAVKLLPGKLTFHIRAPAFSFDSTSRSSVLLKHTPRRQQVISHIVSSLSPVVRPGLSSDFWLQRGSAQTVADIWGVNEQISPCLSPFQVNK